jgi:hypothetical protein
MSRSNWAKIFRAGRALTSRRRDVEDRIDDRAPINPAGSTARHGARVQHRERPTVSRSRAAAEPGGLREPGRKFRGGSGRVVRNVRSPTIPGCYLPNILPKIHQSVSAITILSTRSLKSRHHIERSEAKKRPRRNGAEVGGAPPHERSEGCAVPAAMRLSFLTEK